MPYKDLKGKKDIVLDYIRKNPNATHRKIKEYTKIKLERVFPQGIKSAFSEANVPLPKHLLKRTREEIREQIIKYIQKNNQATTTEIKTDLKVDIVKIFGKIRNAYSAAGIKYPRKDYNRIVRNKSERIEEITNYLKKNPLASVNEINQNLKLNIYKLFNSSQEVYKKAGIKYIDHHTKRTFKKQNLVIEYIKLHPSATQWEINKNCNTHIQEIFKGGIIEAYKLANVNYPKERQIIYGAAKTSIRRRSKEFEDKIIDILKKIGKVKSQVKTEHGIVDAIFWKDKEKFIIEIKDYLSKPISYSEIKQLNKYMIDLNHNKGILISRHPSIKKKVYIGENKIFILTIKELFDCMGA